MDKELMRPTELTIKQKKQQMIGQISRIFIFSPFKVVELKITATDEWYFLIFL